MADTWKRFNGEQRDVAPVAGGGVFLLFHVEQLLREGIESAYLFDSMYKIWYSMLHFTK